MTDRHPALERAWPLILQSGETPTPDGCWEYVGTRSRRGYAVVTDGRRQYRINRLLLGIQDQDPLIAQGCHSCDNPPCVNPDHLFIGTAAENQNDKAAKGRAARGEQNRGGGKLTEDDVRRIRGLVAQGLSDKSIALRFPISDTMVRHIRRGAKWSHVQ